MVQQSLPPSLASINTVRSTLSVEEHQYRPHTHFPSKAVGCAAAIYTCTALQAAVVAAKAGRHEEALQLYDKLFDQLKGNSASTCPLGAFSICPLPVCRIHRCAASGIHSCTADMSLVPHPQHDASATHPACAASWLANQAPLTNKSSVLYVTGRHLSHPQLFVTHSNKAASHLALRQHAAALQVTFPPLRPT